VYGRGTGKSGLWIYGENLRAEDVKQGMPFTGDIGKLLSRLLSEVGLSERDVFITNVVRCRPINDRAAYATEYKACMEAHAALDVPKDPPKLILLLGLLPLTSILGIQKITENRGIIFDCPKFNCKAMATYSLGKVWRDPTEWDTVKVDFQKARDFVLDNPPESLPKNHVELINSKERLLAWLQIMAEPFITERACDLETYGVNFFRDDPSSMSFTVEIDGEMHSIAFLTKPKPEHPVGGLLI